MEVGLHIIRVTLFASFWIYAVLLIMDYIGAATGLYELSSTGISFVYLALIVIGVDRFSAFSWKLKEKDQEPQNESL